MNRSRTRFYCAGPGKQGSEGVGVGEGRLYEPDNGFDGMRNELLSRGIAGRGGVNKGSGCPGVRKSGRVGWGRSCRFALRKEEVVARLRCRKVGHNVAKK
jgi:hypothetical protein